MPQLLTPQEVIDLAFHDSGYFPAEAIGTADIAAAEARYLIPVTGEALWQELIDGAYPDPRSDYAAPAAALAVRLLVQPALDIRPGIGGTVAPHTSAAQPPDREQLLAARRSLRTRLTALLESLSDHLDRHAADYPEYDPKQNILHRMLIGGGFVLKR